MSTNPYIPKQAGDIMLAADWNEMQVKARTELHGHRHTGGDDAEPIGAAGIAPQAIDGRHVNPAADIAAKSLSLSSRSILAEIDKLIAAADALNKSKVERTGDTISGGLAVQKDFNVEGKALIKQGLNLYGPLAVNGATNLTGPLALAGDINAHGSSHRFGLDANGGGQLVLTNNPNDNKIYIEAFNTAFNGSAAELLLTGASGGALPQLTLMASNTTASGNFRATSLTVDGLASFAGNLNIADHTLFLRSDNNHGLGWYGAGKTFAGANVDGPVLFGYSGGALGSTAGGERSALVWDSTGTLSFASSRLKPDQGGAIELGGTDNTPGVGTSYIDFHFRGLTQDFNTRLINSADQRLSMYFANGSGLNFTSSWQSTPDSTTNQSEISNDTGNYRTLMIIGNKSAGLGRRVSVWDRFEVNGTFVNNSSIEKKKDVELLTTVDYRDILAKIANTPLYRYRFKAVGIDAKRRLGVIAEESPEDILDETGKFVSMLDYLGFLFAGLKAQQAQIADYTKRLAALEKI